MGMTVTVVRAEGEVDLENHVEDPDCQRTREL